tara:strand:- start:3956 stop:4351 length:396 start_codon:yes stop_codon:yes gene_type:complete
MVVAHREAPAAPVEDIDAIAGIIILIIPAASISYIGKAIAIVAGIIIVERRIGIAVISAIVDIAVAISAAAIHAAAETQECTCGYSRLQEPGRCKNGHDRSFETGPAAPAIQGCDCSSIAPTSKPLSLNSL